MISIQEINDLMEDNNTGSNAITVGGGQGRGIGSGGRVQNPGGGIGINYLPSDSTFTSGNRYAQLIAGGQNVPNMIAPGMSFSADMPQGFTQPQINSGEVPNPFIQYDPNNPPDAGYIPGGGKYRGGRDDYISIGGGGGNNGFGDDKMYPGGSSTFMEEGPTFNSNSGNNNFTTDTYKVDSSIFDGSGKEDKVYAGGSSTFNEFGETFNPDSTGTGGGSSDEGGNKNTDTKYTYEGLDLSGIQAILDFLKPSFQPDLSNYLTKDDVPTYEQPDLSNYLTKDDVPDYSSYNIEDLLARLEKLENSNNKNTTTKTTKPIKAVGLPNFG